MPNLVASPDVLSSSFLVLVVFIVVAVLAIWGLLVRWQHKALPHSSIRESGASSRTASDVQMRGGARFGPFNLTRPFAKLELTDRGISISGLGLSASSTWSEVQRVRLIRPVVPVGCGVEFSVSGYAPLIFWASRNQCIQVLDLCNRRGVKVDEKPALKI